MDPALVLETIAESQSIQQNSFCSTAAIALLVYNWSINLDDEVNLFWSFPTKWASLLYFAIRYPVVMVPVVSIPTLYPLSDQSCATLTWISEVLALSVYISPACPFFVNLVNYIMWVRPANLPPPLRCTEAAAIPASTYLTLSLIIADLIVIAVTWRATYKVVRETGDLLKTSITQVLLFNGGLYFLCDHHSFAPRYALTWLHTRALLLLNSCQIIFSGLSITFVGDTSRILIFLEPLISILDTNFLINLQKAASSSYTDSDQPGSRELPSLNFAVITQSRQTRTTASADDADVLDAPDVSEVPDVPEALDVAEV
ncbi:hypothetical protein GY45DRAFT_1335108 [Cubamyces sp. BRFM 1775]|nr:hypothetical protein GY45DRAFT_1335108 [Cubamyces sp. BRFM 1775]